MDALESMLDIEQLRLSLVDQNVFNSIAQIHQWINSHGQALLKSNQRLPYTYEEAEEVRKSHEKVELKCMKFLAFYAHVNLRPIPEECEAMRQDLDIVIHNFSDRVKARRHVVVSFFTFYRHLENYCRMLTGIKEEDHIHLPDSVADVNLVIEKYRNSINTVLRKFAHLKDEVDRVKSSLDLVLKLDNESETGFVNPANIHKVLKHLDDLLRQTELALQSCYESQSLLEMEIRIEARMMYIEDEISRSTTWLQQMEDKIIDKYTNNAVGKSTVESDILDEENRELSKKLTVAHDYGCRMIKIYKTLCEQFERETERGDDETAKFSEIWNRVHQLSTEMTERLKLARSLFHNLDSTLEKVEDLLLAINKDRPIIDKNDAILQQYQSDINDIHVDFQSIKKAEKELFNKLYLNLLNQKLTSQNPGFLEIEQTEDMVKMKIFTLLVKIKALDRCLSSGEIQIYSTIRIPDEKSVPDTTEFDNDDLINLMKKYLHFLTTSKLNWKSKALPTNLDQARKAIETHKKLANQSNEYWTNIQGALSEYFNGSKSHLRDKDVNDLVAEAEAQKQNWDKRWNEHYKTKLNPRIEFLLRVQKFSNALEEDLSTLDDLVTRPNNDLPLMKDLRNDLQRMMNNEKSSTLGQLKNESLQLHKSDFNNLIASLADKLHAYNNRLERFLDLATIIEAILKFLPELNLFKGQWHDRVDRNRNKPLEMAQFKDEAKQIQAIIDEFDIDRLRSMATFIYGSSKRVEWLIDELIVDFTVPRQQRVISGSHKVIEKPVVPVFHEKSKAINNLNNYDHVESPKKLVLINAETKNPTKLDFKFEALPRIESDQYDIIWYKDNQLIRLDMDPRFSIHRDSLSGQMHVNIDNCQQADAGKYWCELQSATSGVRKSSPVLLSVYSLKQGSVIPQFSSKTYAAVNEPLSLQLKLNNFKEAPECEMRFNNDVVSVNRKSSPWSKTCKGEMLQFSNKSIDTKDQGLYEFQVGDKIIGQTQLEVGSKPEFAFHELSDKCRNGESIKIAVPMKRFANISTKNINWTKDSVALNPNNNDYKTYVNNVGELVLEIPHFTKGHAGIYNCEVSNEFGTDNLKLDLDVQELNEHVTAKVGDSIVLDLNFTPGLNTDVVWTKDNKPIDQSDPRIQIYNDSDAKSSLKIKNVTVQDNGFYKALVKDTGQNKITTVEIKPVAFAPVIQDYPQSIRIKENGNLNIVCVINSLPFAHSVTWTLKPANGGPVRNLMNNNRYKIINKHFNDLSGHMQRIEIFFDDITLSDAGEYCLRVENTIGWSSVMIPVSVSVPVEAQNKRSPPRFIQRLEKEVFSQINESTSFKCKVTGNPTPIVKWLKDGMELKESNRLKFIKSSQSHELLISQLQHSDSGFYEASVTNSEGVDESKCHLKVMDYINNDNVIVPEENIFQSFAINNRMNPNENRDSRSSQRTQMIFNNAVVRSPPQFITTFKDEIVTEGDDVVLKCCLIGYPEPVVWWSYNTHFINNPRFQLTRERDEYFLVARNIQKSDSGRYSITAENSSGLATCSALIVVDDKSSRSSSIDRSKFPTNSRSLPRDSYSNALKPHPNDESRIIQASPLGLQEYHKSGSRPFKKFIPCPEPDHDKSTTSTKTIKTYHYSGPSGVDLPGIGYIPKINSSLNNSCSSSSSSSKSQVGVAKFVPGDYKPYPLHSLPTFHKYEESSRFSVVESSDCDYPL